MYSPIASIVTVSHLIIVTSSVEKMRGSGVTAGDGGGLRGVVRIPSTGEIDQILTLPHCQCHSRLDSRSRQGVPHFSSVWNESVIDPMEDRRPATGRRLIAKVTRSI